MVMHFMYSLEFYTKSKTEQIWTSAANPQPDNLLFMKLTHNKEFQ